MLDRSSKPLCSYEIVTCIRNVSKPFTKKTRLLLYGDLNRSSTKTTAKKCFQISSDSGKVKSGGKD